MTTSSRGAAPRSLLARIDAAVGRNDIPAATALAAEALAGGVETPLVLNLAAFERECAGQPAQALPLLTRALAMAPADPLVHNALGRAYSKLGRAEEALRAFEAAIRLAPAYSAAHAGRGLALETLGRLDEADESLREAVRLDVANVEALGALAALHVGRRQPGAQAFAEQALALDPWQPAATLALATLDQRAGHLAAVEHRLAPLLQRGGLAPLHEATARRLLADVLDGQGGRSKEALAQYDAANRLLRGVHATTFTAEGTENGVVLCDRLARHFTAVPSWSAAPGDTSGPTQGHVFLVGFPRSGTTLLEQVLASHPEIKALEERPTLGDVGAWFQGAAELDRLANLDGAEADRLRAAYWTRVRAFGVQPDGKVFVDKQPLNSLWLAYVAKLFPDAKILFARRDPRDVVLSCYRRRFVINGATYHFTDLEDLARFYAAVMGLAEVYRERLGLAWRVHRHEDLVDDFDTEARGICDFLGLPWTEAMRDFAETAKRRDVRTPSAQQVRRGLYREGMGQWRAYAEGMAAALPVLEPWVERFGYPAT
jgi:tetratricopeptide (TPR) repeat protein